MKYVVITGGVISGLGKGITLASIGRNLINRGFKVTAIKIDPYINVDAGIISPLQHGEIFVLKDGSEVDLDLGNYERFLGIELTSNHDITTGKIYLSVINKERNGDFFGQTVQIIPHITNEIKNRIRNISENKDIDICLIEIGGTVGDIESMIFLEAIRQMKQEENNNMKLIHVSLLFYDNQGEQKTKPTQHSVKEMRALGLSPDFIICRSSKKLSDLAKLKISMFCNVKKDHVISTYDTSNLYEIPLLLDNEKLTENLILELGLSNKNILNNSWTTMLMKMDSINKSNLNEVKIVIIGKYTNIPDSYMSILEALRHSSIFCGIKIKTSLINSNIFSKSKNINILKNYHGVIIPDTYDNLEYNELLNVINYVKINDIPFFGIDLGMQLSIAESIKSELNIRENFSLKSIITKYDKQPINKYTNQGTMLGSFKINIEKNTILYSIYNTNETFERFRNKYVIKKNIITKKNKQLLYSSFVNNYILSVELKNNLFFIGVQYHPEFISNPNKSHPLFNRFLFSANFYMKKMYQKL